MEHVAKFESFGVWKTLSSYNVSLWLFPVALKAYDVFALKAYDVFDEYRNSISQTQLP